MFEKEVKLRNGEEIKVRALTWEELEKLEDQGINLRSSELPSAKEMRKVLEIIGISQEKIKKLAPADVLLLYGTTVRLSFASEEELKNFE
jgi:hypothetical protein